MNKQNQKNITEKIHDWIGTANKDAELKSSAIELTLNIKICIEDYKESHLITIHGEGNKNPCHIDLEFSSTSCIWEKILSPLPARGFHSFTALKNYSKNFNVSGDDIDIARSLNTIERLFELTSPNKNRESTVDLISQNSLDRIKCGYKKVYRGSDCANIFYEQSGPTSSPSVLFLHTAGADSRQYLEVLCSDEISEHWNCYSFDMPFHGRSSFTVSYESESYRLEMEGYRDWCLAFIEQVIKKPTIVVGCSMGAAICMALAASSSPLVRGVIGVGAPDRSPGRLNPYLDHPSVNSSRYCGAYVRGLMSPESPLRNKRFASWIYSQSGPGVYSGDLWFYSEEYDGYALSELINTSGRPVSLLTGEYDYSCTPEASRRLAAVLKNSKLIVMNELGHFPMTENPSLFLKYVLPELARINSI
ncbi:alpha/beta fold hydrolase [Kushneria sp. Sum13]|uniref:alpha/beta fold hydrolase n=1 Tax=Kushneria sp. Sum13 TaxID=3459196 RepID=UPI004046557D